MKLKRGKKSPISRKFYNSLYLFVSKLNSEKKNAISAYKGLEINVEGNILSKGSK